MQFQIIPSSMNESYFYAFDILVKSVFRINFSFSHEEKKANPLESC
ncbi:hypothetical protein BN1088_1740004 [Sphingobacterium sp. PM2-P1-29]|nr:hypothetical protein BN1088_1740004 [Sphingobacterium sp. PM2-P1-29]